MSIFNPTSCQAALSSDSASAILLHGQWKALSACFCLKAVGNKFSAHSLWPGKEWTLPPSLCTQLFVWWSSSSSLSWAYKDNLPFPLFEGRQLNSFQRERFQFSAKWQSHACTVPISSAKQSVYLCFIQIVPTTHLPTKSQWAMEMWGNFFTFYQHKQQVPERTEVLPAQGQPC